MLVLPLLTGLVHWEAIMGKHKFAFLMVLRPLLLFYCSLNSSFITAFANNGDFFYQFLSYFLLNSDRKKYSDEALIFTILVIKVILKSFGAL